MTCRGISGDFYKQNPDGSEKLDVKGENITKVINQKRQYNQVVLFLQIAAQMVENFEALKGNILVMDPFMT